MTESSLIPNVRIAMEVLGSLRRLGVSLLMDDFGTGYSSLNNLHSFPFDVLKIDRSFVSRMTEGDQPLQIVRTIIELARVMGMDVVAEGIETVEQYHLLREMRLPLWPGLSLCAPHERRGGHRITETPRPGAARAGGLRDCLCLSPASLLPDSGEWGFLLRGSDERARAFHFRTSGGVFRFWTS